MPKIRGIKPETWPISIQAINPTVIYDGKFPLHSRDYYALCGGSARLAFVYVLLDAERETVYIGRARRPGNRFDRHRRREWWNEVDSLVLLEVSGEDRNETHALVSYLESYLIRVNRPRRNVVGVPA